MDLGLTGKTALVLGAGGGLGGAMAEALAAEGARVAVASRRLETAEATVARITAAGGAAFALAWDLARIDEIEPNVRRVEDSYGPIDILINNTGGPAPGPAQGHAPEVWRANFEMMVLSLIALTDRVLPQMKARQWGRIITSTSSGVVMPIPSLALSNTLRACLVGWSKTLAAEVARFGITANVVLPGRVATDRIAFLDQKKAEREGKTVEDIQSASLASIPMGRYGDPKEYGDVVAFLASTRASYVTGSVIRVDGGLIGSI